MDEEKIPTCSNSALGSFLDVALISQLQICFKKGVFLHFCHKELPLGKLKLLDTADSPPSTSWWEAFN